jgi:ribonucleoside-diphosphate reductase alpha chain
MKANNIVIIKRKGHKEPFNSKKLDKVVDWATEGSLPMKEELLRDTEIKLHKEIKIQDMYQQLIITAVNKISMLQPQWEMVAGKLQLLSYYKETYNISDHNKYPSLIDVIEQGVKKKIYKKEFIAKFSEEDLIALDNAIVSDRDLLFNYKGLVSFFDKYCLNYTETKKLELPQISYMRVAMALMMDEKTNRVEYIIKMYHQISKHNYTNATPIMLNAMTLGHQLSSCVLNTVNDDSHNILDTGKNLGIYSKFKGGTALDVTSLRAKGSYIEGTQGYSSGPVPFMKYFESIMKAWNQGGKRNGALAVYFSWWHLDINDLLSLKSNGGTEENRARGLKYAIKLNQFYIDAVTNDLDVYLFDPKDVPNLIGVVGDDFNKAYDEYVNKSSLKKKKINARELVFKLFKERTETGNIYLYHDENVNDATLLNRYIGSSNLCLKGDTQVQTKKGLKDLKDVKKGDYVLSHNTTNDIDEYKKVLDSALMNTNATVMKITDCDSGNSIVCTGNHKVWTTNRGYVEAMYLVECDIVKIHTSM